MVINDNTMLTFLFAVPVCLSTFVAWGATGTVEPYASRPSPKWKISDRKRTEPVAITPVVGGKPPSDAIVLFNGHDLFNWRAAGDKPADWKIGDGFFQTTPGIGDIHTVDAYGDCQLHVEWSTPNPPHGKDQARGNSGIYVMSNYEIQVLDSYKAKTYPDGQAAAVYAQDPPLVNASLPPGAWQTYDIVFHGPRFDDAGKLTRPASVTVLHNGVLVQDNTVLTGPTTYMARPPYKQHAEKMPLLLQDHDSPVRYRNLWIRELKEPAQ